VKDLFLLKILSLFFLLSSFQISLGQQAEFSINNCEIKKSGYLVKSINVDDPDETEIFPTQTIQINVTKIGSYSIETNSVNGIVFSSSGNFTNTGLQNVELKANGIPANYGEFTYLVGNCNFSRYTYIPDRRYKDVTLQGQNDDGSGGISARHHRLIYKAFDSTITGEEWMNSNLGANYNKVGHPAFNPDAIPNSVKDLNAFGSNYQWGRYSDGHELINWTTDADTSNESVNGNSTIKATGDTAPHNKMVLSTQWQEFPNNELWQGESGINNPCPIGFRVPTQAEFNIEAVANNIQNINDAFASEFRIVGPGARQHSEGQFENPPGYQSVYWTSSKPNALGNSHDYHFQERTYEHSTVRGFGFSVRCILRAYSYKECDYDYDGVVEFDLQTIRTNILSTYPSNYKITFYDTFFNAQNGSSTGLVSGNLMAYVTDNPNIIYARLEDASGNFLDGIKLKFYAYQAPKLTEEIPTLFYCTTLTIGIGVFDLTTVENLIVTDNSGLTFTYYTTKEAAENGGTTNRINSPATYSGRAVPVYVRVENENGCYVIQEIKLEITTMNLESSEVDVDPICEDELINLEDYLPLLVDDGLEKYKAVFYLSESDAITNDETKAIQDVENFDTSGLMNFTIWVNFSLLSGRNCEDVISQLNFTIEKKPEIIVSNPAPICAGNSTILTINNPANYILNWYETEDSTEVIFTGNNFTTPEIFTAKSYWVEAVNVTGCISERNEIKIEIAESFTLNTIEKQLLCDDDFDEIFSVDLSIYPELLVSDITNFTFKFYRSEDDLLNDLPINNADLSNYSSTTIPFTIWVKVTDKTNCSQIAKIEFEAQNVIPFNENTILETCEKLVDFTLHQSELTNTTGATFRYYSSFENARNQTDEILNFTNFEFVENTQIYVLISAPNFCSVIVPFYLQKGNLSVNASEFNLKDCLDETGFNTYNLTNYLVDLGINRPSDYEISYFDNLQNAENNEISLAITDFENYQISTVGTTIIYVRIAQENCFIISKIIIQILDKPILNSGIEELLCDDDFDGVFKIDLSSFENQLSNDSSNLTFYYYASKEDLDTNYFVSNYADFTVPTFPFTVWVKAVNDAGCESFTTFVLNQNQSLPINSTNEILKSCDENIDLTLLENDIYIDLNAIFNYYENLLDAQNERNPIVNPNRYQPENSSGLIYVRVKVSGFCDAITNFNYQTQLQQELELSIPEHVYLCLDGSVVVNAGNDFDDDRYVWTWNGKTFVGSTIEISEEAIYTLNITDANGCEYQFSVEATYFVAPKIIEIIAESSSITVNATGEGELLYSIDGENWQTLNVFNNLPQGVNYTIYVKANDCMIVTQEIYLLKITNFISPNGDGVNDEWTIKLNSTDEAHLKIFDRYGKTFYQESSTTGFKWNGKLNGSPLSSGDYWYILEIPTGTNGTMRKFTGNITVKNK